MVVKTITIKEEAYNVLAGMKRPDESFSDVILRIRVEKPVTAKDLFGKLKMSDAEFQGLKKHVNEMRESINRSMEERRRVLDRHFSSH